MNSNLILEVNRINELMGNMSLLTEQPNPLYTFFKDIFKGGIKREEQILLKNELETVAGRIENEEFEGLIRKFENPRARWTQSEIDAFENIAKASMNYQKLAKNILDNKLLGVNFDNEFKRLLLGLEGGTLDKTFAFQQTERVLQSIPNMSDEMYSALKKELDEMIRDSAVKGEVELIKKKTAQELEDLNKFTERNTALGVENVKSVMSKIELSIKDPNFKSAYRVLKGEQKNTLKNYISDLKNIGDVNLLALENSPETKKTFERLMKRLENLEPTLFTHLQKFIAGILPSKKSIINFSYLIGIGVILSSTANCVTKGCQTLYSIIEGLFCMLGQGSLIGSDCTGKKSSKTGDETSPDKPAIITPEKEQQVADVEEFKTWYKNLYKNEVNTNNFDLEAKNDLINGYKKGTQELVAMFKKTGPNTYEKIK